jgi:hypothetical protein
LEPSSARVTITDNIFDFPLSRASAGEGFTPNSSMDWLDRNVVHVQSPYWRGALFSQHDYAVSTGICPWCLRFQLQPWSEAWNVVTTDGDRPGPRFAGTLLDRLPFLVPRLVPVIDPENDDSDRDGDALIDRWDNCPETPNPGWADSDGNGVGDACQP